MRLRRVLRRSIPTAARPLVFGLCADYALVMLWLSSGAATLRCDAPLASFGESRTVSHRSAKAEQYRIVRRKPKSIASFGESRTVSRRGGTEPPAEPPVKCWSSLQTYAISPHLPTP